MVKIPFLAPNTSVGLSPSCWMETGASACSYPLANVADGNAGSYTHTTDEGAGAAYWMQLNLQANVSEPLRVWIQARKDCCVYQSTPLEVYVLPANATNATAGVRCNVDTPGDSRVTFSVDSQAAEVFCPPQPFAVQYVRIRKVNDPASTAAGGAWWALALAEVAVYKQGGGGPQPAG